jgi:hypothetical protein
VTGLKPDAGLAGLGSVDTPGGGSATAAPANPRTPPGPRHLFIVSRDNPHLATYLRLHFLPETEVAVLIDRRQGERRRVVAGATPDRRRNDRRSRPEADREVHLTSYALVTLLP